MDADIVTSWPEFRNLLGLDEEPLGLFYTDTKPAGGYSPQPGKLPTREQEIKGEIDWQEVFGGFSCAIGHIWRARKKRTAAYFSSEQFGCPGGGFWMGFLKPQTDAIMQYISTGIPGWMDGELYCDSPGTIRRIFNHVDPRPAPRRYCVIKPISQFTGETTPELVIFFTRPEALCGLHQLTTFVTGDPEVVMSPWSAACGSIAAWPLHYLSKGLNKAVVGGWDPSARKFFKTDELSFTIPYPMFAEMLARGQESFLTTKTWQTVKKKIVRSRKAWNATRKNMHA